MDFGRSVLLGLAFDEIARLVTKAVTTRSEVTVMTPGLETAVVAVRKTTRLDTPSMTDPVVTAKVFCWFG